MEDALMVRTVRGPYLITTTPSVTTCRTCRRTVLAATINGLDAHLDLAALNDVGELVALLSGCRTYELAGDELVRRNPAMIGKARGSRPVLADHRCALLPDDQIDTDTMARAIVLVVTAMGGEVVTARDNSDAPF